MMLWLDAHLSPRLAHWIQGEFGVGAAPLRELGLRDAADEAIFDAARRAGAVVLTKDSDFVRLLERLGSPPKVIWLTCGNTSEKALQQLLTTHLPTALTMLAEGESLVEISTL